MKNKIRNTIGLGALALSAVAILASCNNNTGKKFLPNITTLGCEYFDVTHNELEFGKDVTITIKPKENSYVHIRKDDGEYFKPFVGYGNALYRTKAPLVENVSFTYKAVSEDSESKDYETFTLNIKGEYFKDPIIISYRAEERAYTPQGKEEGEARDVSELRDVSDYNGGENVIVDDNNIEYYRLGLSVYNTPSESYLCNGIQKFHIQMGGIDDQNPFVFKEGSTCKVTGITSGNDEVDVKNEVTVSDSRKELIVTINLSEIYDKKTGAKFQKLKLNPSIVGDYMQRGHIKLNVKNGSGNLTKAIYANHFVTHDSTPIFDNDEAAELELAKGASFNYCDYAWLQPWEDSSKYVATKDESWPSYTNANFKFVPYLVDGQEDFELNNNTFYELDKNTTPNLSKYFKGYIQYQYILTTQLTSQYISFVAFVPNDFIDVDGKTERPTNDNNKMLVLFDTNINSVYEYSNDLYIDITRDFNENDNTPNYVAIGTRSYSRPVISDVALLENKEIDENITFDIYRIKEYTDKKVTIKYDLSCFDENKERHDLKNLEFDVDLVDGTGSENKTTVEIGKQALAECKKAGYTSCKFYDDIFIWNKAQ